MTANMYQQMIDRSWRRCGIDCYFPINRSTCCPNYSISCSATKFQLSTTQIKCIDRVNSFLINGSTKEKVRLTKHANETLQTKEMRKVNWKRDVKYIKDNFVKLKQSPKARDKRFASSCERVMRQYNIDLEEAVLRIRDKLRYNKCEPSLVLEDHLYPKKANFNSSFLDGLKPKHRLQIRLVHVDSEESRAIREEEHKIMVKYQEVVHKDPADEWTMPRFKNFLVDSPIKSEPMQDRDYYPPETSGVNTGSISSSKNVDIFSNQSDEFVLVKPPPLPTHFGTYHCLYLLDDELIAVGVVDFLPKCLTTVYFFYDPKYAYLNLGIYSGLVEISIVRQLFKHFQGPADKNCLKYYYMGFYVHTCKKMRYKTTFKPSYLLCPLTRHYVPVERCLSILDERKFGRFDPDHDDEIESIGVPLDILFHIPISTPVQRDSTKMLDYFRWLRSNTNHSDVEQLVDSFLTQYEVAIGPKLASQILLKLDAIHVALVERHQKRLLASARSQICKFY